MIDSHPGESASLADRNKRLLIASIAGPAFFFLALISYNFVDIDLWHQMALIRESLRAGHLLRADPFAYTPTIRPWIDHEWGAGAIAYFATLWFGGGALLVLKFVLALATGALCWRCSTKLGADYRLTSVCAPLTIFLAYLGFFAVVRAQVYSFFFLALLVFFWECDRAGSRNWLIAWLIVFPLWVNLHGGFVLGIGLTGLYCIREGSAGRERSPPAVGVVGHGAGGFPYPLRNFVSRLSTASSFHVTAVCSGVGSGVGLGASVGHLFRCGGCRRGLCVRYGWRLESAGHSPVGSDGIGGCFAPKVAAGVCSGVVVLHAFLSAADSGGAVAVAIYAAPALFCDRSLDGACLCSHDLWGAPEAVAASCATADLSGGRGELSCRATVSGQRNGSFPAGRVRLLETLSGAKGIARRKV
jgi:hypothetical protein